jgi:outer membrane protein assembly factor BamB
MRFFSKIMVLVCLGLGLQACTLVDNYILGKDNTLRPKRLLAIKPKVGLQRVWSAKIGDNHQTQMYYKLKPVTFGGKIYTSDTSGRICAVSLHGKILWTSVLPHGIVSGPTVAHDRIVVGTDAGTLVAVSTYDGHTIWERPLSGDVLAQSVTSGHVVIAKTIDGRLYALDLQTGKPVWQMEHGSPNLILKASSSPVVMGNTLLVGYSDGKLDAVDIAQGRVLWQRGIAYANGASDVERLVDIDADLLVRNQWLYLASYQGSVGAFDIDNGQFVWSKQASIYKNMAMDHDTLYATDSRDVLWAYQLSTGQIKWKQTALKGYGLTEPILLGSRVVVGDKSGQLHVLARSNGELIGRELVGAPIYISPSASHGRLLVMTSDGVLHAYKVENL